MLVYMRHIIEALEQPQVDVKREDFAAMASRDRVFPRRDDAGSRA